MLDDSIDAVMARLEPLLDDFDAVVRVANSRYQTYPSDVLIEHSPRTQAAATYDHMVAEAEKRFDGRSDIRMLELQTLKLWLIGDHAAIRWKKMGEDGRSRNYPTHQAKAYDGMQELPGLPPLPVRLTVGYVLDATGTTVKRVQVARPNGRRIEWCAAIVPADLRVVSGRVWEEVSKQVRM